MNKIEKSNYDLKNKIALQNIVKSMANVKNEIDAYKADTLTLSQLKKETDKEFTLDYISVWISFINDMSNVKQKMTPEQIEFMAAIIFEDFHYLKISDLYLISKKALKGQYGQLYESLNIEKITSWFYKYTNERANKVNLDISNKDHKEKPDNDRSSDTKSFKDAFKRSQLYENYRKKTGKLPEIE